jgi:Protein of unknown function (DUF3667)/zinc-ribbon domain
METAPAACSNCAAPLPPEARFCPQCGQRTQHGPHSLREAVQAVVGRDYSPDGRLWLTLRRLVVPGALTADWFAGRQQRYLGPMRLLLLVLLVAVLGLQLVMRVFAPDPGSGSWRIEYGPGSAQRAPLVLQRQGAFEVRVHGGLLQPLLAPWATRVQAAVARMPEAELRLRVQTVTTPARWHALLLLLPQLVLGLALAHAGLGRRFSEHAVFALHFAALAIAAVLLLAPLELLGDAIPAGEVIGLAIALWFTVGMRRYYGGAWWAVALRAVFVLGLLLLPLPYLDAFVALSTLS